MPLFVPPLKIALRKRIWASAHLLLQKMTSAQRGATNGHWQSSRLPSSGIEDVKPHYEEDPTGQR